MWVIRSISSVQWPSLLCLQDQQYSGGLGALLLQIKQLLPVTGTILHNPNLMFKVSALHKGGQF